jgi:hypothetical protein
MSEPIISECKELKESIPEKKEANPPERKRVEQNQGKNLKEKAKKEIEVEVKTKVDDLIPIIKKNEDKFEIIVQDQLSKNLYAKVDEDDPIYNIPDYLSYYPKKRSEKRGDRRSYMSW